MPARPADDDTLLVVHARRQRAADEGVDAASVRRAPPGRGLPGAARSLRRGRHGAGPARAGQRPLRRRRRAGLGGRHGQGRDEGAVRRGRACRRRRSSRSYAAANGRPARAAVLRRIAGRFAFPVFVKPANLGSSVGISKAQNDAELAAAIDLAAAVRPEGARRGGGAERARDRGRGARQRRARGVGARRDHPVGREFYDYEAKYLTKDSGLHRPGAADGRADRRGPAPGHRGLPRDRRRGPGPRRLPPRSRGRRRGT